MAVVAVLGLASGCLVTTDGDGGEGGLGGNTTNGGSPTTGGNTTDGGGGSTSNASGGGGAGGGTACTSSDECPPATEICTEALCDGVCSIIVSAEGVLCEVEAGGAGFCNGDEAAPACVECLSDADCNGGTCNAEGVCEGDEPLGGDCGQNFCQLLPADNACGVCLIENQQCADERNACVTDMVAGSCDNCAEWLNGMGDDFCAGSLDKAQAFLNCVCTPGVCAE
jgi:hypothetical protein